MRRNLARLTDAHAVRRIERLRARHFKAAAMLADHLGTDIAKIANELEKLAVSVPEGTKRITDSDIETYTGISEGSSTTSSSARRCSRATRRRALRIAGHFAPQPQGASAAGHGHGALRTVPAALPAELPLLAGAPQRHARAARRRTDARAEGEQPLRRRRAAPGTARMAQQTGFAILGLLREYDAKSKRGINAGGAPTASCCANCCSRILLPMTEAYIHQTIHTLDGNARHLDAHIAAADEASRALFGRAFRPDAAALAARIGATLAARNGRPTTARPSCASCSPPCGGGDAPASRACRSTAATTCARCGPRR